MMSFHELKAGLEDIAYDREVVSTPEGRRSLVLREKAQRLKGMGQLDDSLELFQQAVALFDEKDDGAAAAAARHDLGTTLSDKKRDGPSLATAERLLERAMRSPARARVPRRISETENSLAICLRRQAKLTSGEERREFLERASRLYRSIIWKLERSGPIGLETLANTHLNLGNLLGQELGERDSALREYERAARTAQQVKKFAQDAGEEPSYSVRRAFHYAHVTPAGMLRMRGRKQDLREAERLLTRALTWEDPQFEPLIRMEQAELHLAGDAPDRVDQAWATLAKVRQEWLPEEEQLHLAHLMRRAGSPDAALERLSVLIRRGIGLRALTTISDFEADAASRDFQEAAALAARIYVQDKQQPVEAFLVLENASGLRFNEMLSWQSWSPRTPLTRALHERLMRTMSRTWGLDGMARILEKLEPGEQQARLDDLLERVPEHLSDHEDQRFLLSSYAQARQTPVPSQVLQRLVDTGRKEVERLRFALEEKDEGYVAAERILSTELDANSLAALLREEPGQVFVRLSLESELLVVAVWLEGDTLQGRSTRIALKGRLLRLLGEDPEKMDFERLSGLLAELDLSAALPPERRERAVLLPSYWAASLPLAALGPRGSRLIDHFASLIWLPSLAPLRARQAPLPPRSGHLVVIPETTKFHRMALHEPRPGERRIEGAEATLDAVSRALGEVDTLCIYAHGSHGWGEPPVIKLRGKETLDFDQLAEDVRGMERVENWACESGTNRPVDPLTPPTDDAFGLDFKLLMQGARSAIGTLWKVPDLVTATIVRRYRQHLGEGMDAACALASAQRWWDAVGLPRLLQCLMESPTQEAIATFSASLGFEASPDVPDSPLEMLAPVSETLDEKQLRYMAARLACPVSWAGLRFVGLPGRRPQQPWQPPEDRPLTAEENQELEQLLTRELPAPKAFSDLQEERLARARSLAHPFPMASQAIEVARLMRERLHSSYRDNLLAGLGWLHEALAAPGLPEEQRARLSVEAAHLWLDVSLGERLVPMHPAPVALARAETLLTEAPHTGDVGADAIAARARLQWIRALDSKMPFEELRALAGRELADVGAALERVTPGTYESLRIAGVALELLLFRGSEHEEAADARLLERAHHLLRAVEPTAEFMPALCRLRTALDAFAPDEELPMLAAEFLTARELAQVMLRTLHRQPAPARGSQALTQSFDQMLSRLEGRHWGYEAEDREEMLRSVGTPGSAYRQLLAAYLAGHAQFRPDAAAHHLACIQYACDLRVGLLHRLVRYRVRHGDKLKVFGYVWDLVRIRQALHTALADAALLSVDEGQARPHARDPYSLPTRQLLEPMNEVMSTTAWSLGELCEVVRQGEEHARTAAFEVAQASAGMEQAALQAWEKLSRFQREVEERIGRGPPVPLQHILTPPLDLQANEDNLRKLAPGNAVLGLTWAPLGEQLLAMACWNDGTGVRQRTLRLKTGPLYAALQALFLPRTEDGKEQRGHSGPRRGAWEEIERCMAPILEALVAPEGRSALHWSVIAPGSLRALPLLGLRVRGRPLAEQVLSLVHQPHLGFGTSRLPSEGESDFTACLLARNGRHAATRFGEAAMETLRRAHPPQLLADFREPSRNRLMELEALLPQAERIQTLRLYGVGGLESLNDTMALLRLEGGGQPLRDRNTHELFLPRCQVVELWACTAGSAGSERMLFDEGDRIPGLAASFLCNGAAAVLDVAWPVHDIVKALVCEQYGLLRRSQGHGPERLVTALRETGTLLRMLGGLPAGSQGRDVLTLLDELRRLSARKHGLSTGQVVAFASDSGTTELEQQDAAGLIEELSHPSHLGAFRWWGM